MTDQALAEFVVSRESAIRRRWLPLDVAAEARVAFEHRFGKGHFWLACHAALPWIVTPELVSLIRINFLDGLDIPWIADADFLLSPLCQPGGNGNFVVEPRVREVLLVELQDRFGAGRLTQLAEFLDGYTATPLAAAQSLATTEMQRWIALAYLVPDDLVSEMTATLRDSLVIPGVDRQLAGQLRVAIASEIAALPLEQALLAEEFDDLRTGARTIAYYWYGDHREAFRRGLPAALPADLGDEPSEGQKQLGLFINWARVKTLEPPVAPPVTPVDEPTMIPPEAIAQQQVGPIPPPLSTSDADLEVGLSRGYDGGYRVTLRSTQPDHEGESTLESTIPVELNLETLSQIRHEPEQYGRQLTTSLFVDPAVRAMFAQTTSRELPLRLRLFVDASAPELHALNWETLRDPNSESRLIDSDRILLFRYLSSQDWRRVRLKPKNSLQVLAAIPNPTKNLGFGPGQWPLPPTDVERERVRALDVFGSSIPVTLIYPPVTLIQLMDLLRASPPDILYLSGHVGSSGSELVLYLDSPDGEPAPVSVSQLAERFRALEQLPQLVVLAPRQSPTGDRLDSGEGQLTAFGPRLAAAGVPAVVAAPSEITEATFIRFMTVFFSELQIHGQADLAMTRARIACLDRDDSWMPVLFLRLKNGRIWYVPGFADEVRRFAQWPALLNAIKKGRCTPILGPEVNDAVFGTDRDVAQRLARAYGYPLAPSGRDDLPQVAEFLSVQQAPRFARQAILEELRQELLRRYRGTPPPGLAEADLGEIAAAVGKQQREADPAEPHRVLAGLPLPVYVTTNPDNLLADALREASKDPQVELFRWSSDPGIEWPPSLYERNPAFEPTPEQPLVFHLFGHFDFPDTLLLTTRELDRFIIGATRNRDAIPGSVRSGLARDSLLFLGLQLESRQTQVVLQSLVNQEGEDLRRSYINVMQQLAPEEDRFLAADSARRYLDAYAAADRIEIYWGSVADFARELVQHRPTPGDDPFSA